MCFILFQKVNQTLSKHNFMILDKIYCFISSEYCETKFREYIYNTNLQWTNL